MAQTVKINGVTYSEVTEVKIPTATDSNTMAVFTDTSDANASAGDLKKDKTAYVNGKKVTGTKTDPSISVTDGVLSIA